jgi:NodT family efflux transporter outer membrane factor (OMF) lipoprotein
MWTATEAKDAVSTMRKTANEQLANARGEDRPSRMHPKSRANLRLVAVVAIAASLCGCTSLTDYVHNGFKVGPNYCRPAAPVAKTWIDANDARVKTNEVDLSRWWTVFNDPALNSLICTAYHQNLTLREAGFRVLEARAQLGIDTGELFPQTQQMTGSFTRNADSKQTANGQFITKRFFSQTNFGFNMAWELDFWGRFRRAIEADESTLDQQVELYDSALVTLLGDIATNYDQMRTLEQQIKYAQDNVQVQRDTLTIVEARFKASTTSELDVDQARSTLAATEAAIPEFEISLRQTINQLCILMGMPPEELRLRLGPGNIPTAPPEVVVGIPADLLRRRPDVRAAERAAAAQSALIGVAQSEFYPHISILGTVGWSAQSSSHLIEPSALDGSFGPSFTWNILNYGRILNNVRLQDYKFQELIATYQQTVLNANQDAENGMVTFLRGQERTRFQAESVDQAKKAVQIALVQYKAGTVDFTTVTQVEQTLVAQQNTLAIAQGEIVTGLIQIYRALGGGWEIRINGCQEMLQPPGSPRTLPMLQTAPPQPPVEGVPAPMPQLPPTPQGTDNRKGNA